MKRCILTLLLLAAAPACRSPAPDADPSSSADAGASGGPVVVEVETLGLKLVASSVWAEQTLGPSEGAEVRTWAELRRHAPDAVVPPRLIVTSETARGDTTEAVFASVVRDLRQLETKAGITIERLGFSARHTAAAELGRIRLRYRVGEAKGRRIEHSSLLVHRPSHPMILSTITGTFMSTNEAEPWADEIEALLDRVQVLPLDPPHP